MLRSSVALTHSVQSCQQCRSFPLIFGSFSEAMLPFIVTIVGAILTTMVATSQAGYTIQDDYNPSNFFKMFDFYNVDTRWSSDILTASSLTSPVGCGPDAWLRQVR